jgi:hypothetical protein
MNKRIVIPTLLLLVALLVAGCGFQVVTGSGKVATENRSLSGFTSVTLAGIGNVYLTQGATEAVRIEAEDNLIPYFETVVEGSTLKIGIKSQYMGVNLHPTQPVKFYVTLPKIEAVTLAGSGNIFGGTLKTGAFKIALLGSGNISADTLTGTTVDISLSGSGNITLGSIAATDVTQTIAGSGNIQVDMLTADKVTSKTSGSGSILLGGKVSGQSAEILGSGDYRASGLKSATASVRVTGSGNSQVSASGTLDVTILGSGDVTYSGTPKVNVSISGSGKVNQASQ